MATRLGSTTPRKSVYELVNPLAIAFVFTIVAQQWSGLDTPDSEFYASLAIFTSDVTDRAPIDSYYWTRLGLIAPAHVLIGAFGIWEGFALYKAALTLIISVSVFYSARLFTGLWTATWLTAAAVSSSVVLSYLGNSYITGSIMASTSALVACALRPGLWSGILSGALLGWAAMTYPAGALLGGSIWLALTLYTWRTGQRTGRQSLVWLAIACVATVVTSLLFLWSGKVLFPGLDWLATYLDASSFDYSVYSSGEWVWLTDISLLVPCGILVLAIANVRLAQRRRPAELALIVSATSIGFILAYAPFFGAHFLEAPPSQAMLWPPALLAVILIAASRSPESPLRSAAAIFLALGLLGVIIAAGYLDPGWSFWPGLLIAGVLVAATALSPQRPLVTLTVIALLLAGSQLLQNSREARGQFMLDPYSWAYQPNPNDAKIRTAVNAQEWLVANTTRDDQILLWVDGPWVDGDRELYTVAAMQLWGENRLTLEPTFGDDYSQMQLATLQPTVIAMYGKTMATIDTFWRSLPQRLSPSPPRCYDFDWPIDPTSPFPTTTGHLCLTDVTSG